MQEVYVTGEVHYNGHKISDPAVRSQLMEISISIGRTLEILSGDRKHALSFGAGKNSYHLRSRAADFHLDSIADAAAFNSLRQNRLIGNGFGLLQHGPFTETEGPHLHLEHRFSNAPATFGVEGLTPATRGIYSRLPDQ